MNWWRQLALAFGFLAAAAVSSAQNPPLPLPPTNIIPPVALLQPPVEFFRQLLAMSPAERMNSLTNRTPEARAKILAKVREYQRLGADERELRLRATELRWWLMPLLRMPPESRAARLELVPADLRGLVDSRLTQWDILPPGLKQEFLDNDRTLHYFARIETTNAAPQTPEQQKISEQFNQFFELTAGEKKQALGTLSAEERGQMEATLKSFEKLPPQQRFLCVRNYAKFAGMAPAERAEFLRNAGKWSKMSPQERQAWRDLVAQVPVWPPMPGPAVPPNLVPPLPGKNPRPNVATN